MGYFFPKATVSYIFHDQTSLYHRNCLIPSGYIDHDELDNIIWYGILYVALCEVYAVYAFAASRLVDVAVHLVCLCVEAS